MKSSSQKRLAINVVSSLVAFGVNAMIAFFLSPYIVRTLGSEANGFITLANDFVSYASILTLALNSMAARFVALYYHKGDFKKANAFYTASFISNVATVLLLMLPGALCILSLDSFLEMPASLVGDIKLLFGLIFLNFLLTNTFNTWNVATYVTNTVYLTSIRTLVANLIKSSLIFLFFLFFQPSVYYVGLATLLATSYVTLYSLYYKRKLLPDMHVRRQDFDIKNVGRLFLSGIWNSLNSAGSVLLNGLDLFIANLLIGSAAMGVLSLAKTIPNAIINLAATLPNAFAPKLTQEYAEGHIDSARSSLKQAMRISSVIVTIPVSILMVLGFEFYTLWVPSQNAATLHLLSILACMQYVFVSGVACLLNVFTTLNKLKVNSVVVLASGLVNSLLVLLLVLTTNLGVYSIAAVSSVVGLLRNLLYTAPYAAKYLDLPWYTFFPEIGLSAICSGICCLVAFVMKTGLGANSWLTFLLCCGITAVVSLGINMMIVLTKKQRQDIFSQLKGLGNGQNKKTG